MDTSLTAKARVEIKAPPSRVWDALTDPKMIKQYLFGTDTFTTWKVGDPIVFKGEWEGKQYEDRGTIMALEKEKELRYTYWSSFSGLPDSIENYANITCVLTHKDDKTMLTVTQDHCSSEEQRNHSEQNWHSVLNTMKDLLER